MRQKNSPRVQISEDGEDDEGDAVEDERVVVYPAEGFALMRYKKFINKFEDKIRAREENERVGFAGPFYIKLNKGIKHMCDTTAGAF